MNIRVITPGLLTTVQDAGRSGHASIGVGNAGAMDSVALRLANCLVGNSHNAAALEITLLGPRLCFDDDALIALSGAPIRAHCDDREVPSWRPVAIRAGSELTLGGMRHGARSYLAIAGGINTQCVLGSRSSDLNAGLGPPMLVAGAALAMHPAPVDVGRRLWKELHADRASTRAKMAAAAWSIDPTPWFNHATQTPLRMIAGSHFPHLDQPSRRALFDTGFRVGVDSNRVGYRLQGATLALREALELVSEGVSTGTVQLPPGGEPIVLMAEAPSCGGYPRIGQIIAVDLPRLAQYRPGDTLHFGETSLDDAQTRYLQRERALSRIAQNIAQRLRED